MDTIKILRPLKLAAARLSQRSQFWRCVLRPVIITYHMFIRRPPSAVNATEVSTQATNLQANPSQGELSPEMRRQIFELRKRRIDGIILTEEIVRQQDIVIAKYLHYFFTSADIFCDIGVESIATYVSAYRDVYARSPITNNSYGMNFPGGLLLFVMAKCLSPSMVVESGVYKGLSSYLLANAVPSARILAFDVDLSDLEYQTAGVTYYAFDWMQVDIMSDGKSLAFFDDHQNQARRIIEAHRRGFRWLIFDDSWPLEVITGCGLPPVPSVDMIMADIPLGEKVTWVEANFTWTYVHDAQMAQLCLDARKLIRRTFDLPTLYRQTGVAPSSALKLVELI